MKNALIYCFTYDGHRQVYAQYFIEVLLKRDYRVCLVSDLSEAGIDYSCLAPYHSNSLVEFEWIPDALSISLRDLRKLQDDMDADLTILLEADVHLGLLSQQVLPGYPRLRGKNIGVFIRSTNYIHRSGRYPVPVKLVLQTKAYVKKSLKQILAFWKNDPVLFHEVSLPSFKLLDAALTPDEVFVEARANSFPYHWFPDIIFPLRPDDPDIAHAELTHWQPLLSGFLDANRNKEVLLYFGHGRPYKGYDTLLKLAFEENCCFIHCGVVDVKARFDVDVDHLRENLKMRGLLFETNTYIRSYSAVRLFFEACQYIILPYRKHIGSSGVMLQSVHFGKPVLVPDSGLMAERAQRMHLGLTYRADDEQDLRLKWKMLKDELPGFTAHFAQNKQLFVPEDAKHIFDAVLTSVE